MSTLLKRKVTRITQSSLDGCFGPDRGRRIAITLVPGTDVIPDLIVLRPHGTRRPESIAAIDCYAYAMRCRVSKAQRDKALAKAQAIKARKDAAKRERELARAVRREQS
jgi:hypothetical protein